MPSTDAMNVLVTGGAGYVGSVTTAALLEAGHRVIVLDDLRAGHAEAVPSGAEKLERAITDADAVRGAIASGVDACIHFAGRIEAGESMRRPEEFFVANTAASLGLLDVLIEGGVDRFVFSSTAAVYGDPVRIPIHEDDPLAPTNAYGETKLLVERALAWMHRLRGLRYASLRYFNASGATAQRGEMHDPETHLIPLVLRVALGLAPEAIVFGDDYPTPDGTCIRDYVHVSDLADAHVLALNALEELGAITCNLGNGLGFSVREVIAACRRATGHEIPERTAPRRGGDPPQLVASSDRARTVLGWKPRHPELDDIVSSAWRWHSGHRAAASRRDG